ncbi:type I restriction endonuclease subunit M [Pseudoxanthomonas sp. Root65]|uniref:type I restriction-modification system subunit M n=1 Tax=Pseudoxanthomonas sp. Root65 TaxID=1736576 RepID=UPI0007003FFF|nr:class I SAM-dependent DNA methyltransferase [Pseudoxanthomonas sp. Root65]KRA52305.1 type I restriction endonuclease subunit M [Pseudoxanthomonas sp. Root65]
MAIKKSELYSSLWASCDELRGGMDASQYKDYVLVLLFIKYISDKYAGQRFAPITVPKGASFKDMVALKGRPDIGDQINKKIIAPLANTNKLDLSEYDFNDAGKLGSGKEMVERLTNLIAIFETPALDFSKNRADGDDILGDAYEYLMRHFATESGKSKGQFYTPAEVSRIMAQVLGIRSAKTSAATTVYDPTCGSGSLLLKIADEAGTPVTLYGQEKDVATSGLARMNMILHNNPGAAIVQGNTLADPKFKDGGALKTFDYVVANPPFSDKRWSTGIDPLHDPYGRFDTFGVPPAKQGDYAYLLHIVRSLKSTGKGACILPHGVLFRGNAEAEIRKALIRKGYIKGIIGLPANLFYGTGIPACIVVIDKQGAAARKGIFMVDASAGFMKDGPKNRLREQDIHRIVDAFSKQDGSDPRYARMVGFDEIEKNDWNLNLPRYIDSQQTEDRQDIEGHLKGGIPVADIDALQPYWEVCPKLRAALFKPNRKGYVDLAIDKAAIKSTIYDHPQFTAFINGMNAHFQAWRDAEAKRLKALKPGFHPKELIVDVAERLLAHYKGRPLIDAYAVYQHVMDYWATIMQDDAYLIASDGWKAMPYRVIETKKGKNGKPDKQIDKGWACDLVPKPLMVARYFAADQAAIDALAAKLEQVTAQLAELEEEHGGDEGAYAELDKVNKANVAARLKEIKGDKEAKAEAAALAAWLKLSTQEVELKKQVKDAEAALDAAVLARYPKLSETATKVLVVDDKWLATLDADIHGEMDRISQRLTARVKELAERYETPLPQAANLVAKLEMKVNRHLERMGFAWV